MDVKITPSKCEAAALDLKQHYDVKFAHCSRKDIVYTAYFMDKCDNGSIQFETQRNSVLLVFIALKCCMISAAAALNNAH